MIPQGVMQIRQDLCTACADIAHDPCARCLHGHWGPYIVCPDDALPAPQPLPNPTSSQPSAVPGPGTHLKSMLSKLGINPVGPCHCTARAEEMDRLGPDWCEQNIETIVQWLREESTRRHLPFLPAAARLLIRRAIKKSRLSPKVSQTFVTLS